jgi:Ion channel
MTGKPRKGIFRYFAHWSEEQKLTWLLVALIFDTVIVYPLVGVVGSNVAIQIINSVVLSAILLLGLVALTGRKITRRLLGVIVVIVISIRFVRLILGTNWLIGWEISLSLATLATVIIFVYLLLKYVYKEGPVTRQRIQGAVAAYLLIAMTFGVGYQLTSSLIPGAFTFRDKVSNLRDFNFNYFSVTTITTLGYGDIIPVHPVSRTLVMMEALIGQLYPAILLARLVSSYVSHSQRSDK